MEETPQDSNGIVVTEAELEVMYRTAVGLLKKIAAIQNKNIAIANLDRGDVWIKGKRPPK